MSTFEEIRGERLKKLKAIKDAGVNPFPVSVKRDINIKDVMDNFENFRLKYHPQLKEQMIFQNVKLLSENRWCILSPLQEYEMYAFFSCLTSEIKNFKCKYRQLNGYLYRF